ncbi:uncharacterized protein LOC111067338 [Drosophila obscura]|uniref:uncharacterized protein LOC111067338 n=1 Tax=Drosophila obscura TaxID=7282 RepID=UPI001BB2592F|nr:uncharacterized protein LOC111067338 [Drosophila obscura]
MYALTVLLFLGSPHYSSAGDSMFALKLFGELAKANSLQNIVFSPSSIRTALAMAYMGSEGTTEEELKKTLSLEGADKNEVAQGFAQLLAKGQNPIIPEGRFQSQFSYANRIYVAEKFVLDQAYQGLVGKYFNAPAENVNFGDSVKVSQKINSWVEEKTHHLIKDLVSPDSLTPDTAAILINAIYFNAHWVKDFIESNTKLQDFVSYDGVRVKTSTMYQREFFRYAELPSLKAKALEMTYENTNIVFLIILPLEEQGLSALEEKLSGVDLNEISSQLKSELVQVQLPKFKLEFDVSLVPVLRKLGLETMFSDRANFKSLAQGPNLKISDVVHKAFIDVNEQGTTAAAATTVKMVVKSSWLYDGPTYNFIVDHPFFFAIKDEQSTFFLGHVTRPNYCEHNKNDSKKNEKERLLSSQRTIKLQFYGYKRTIRYSAYSFSFIMMASMYALTVLLFLVSPLYSSAGDSMFALKLFGELAKANSEYYYYLQNIVFSPSSIRTALAMTYMGSEGTTEEELKKTLSLEGSDKIEVAQGFAQLLVKGEIPKGIFEPQFSYANRIYVAEKFVLAQAYQGLVGKYFKTPAENVNFGDSVKVSQRINSWVEAKTHHQIKDLVSPDSLTPDTAAILINAIYFKANWVNRFSEAITKDHDFVSYDGLKVKTNTMFQWEFFRYAELPSLKAKALEMPYKGTNIVFLIILPLEEQGLGALEEKLSGVDLNEISSQLKSEHVQLQLPKFKLEFDVSLVPVLRKLGLETMFSDSANFKSLAQGPNLKISDVVHKAFIDVNEQGTTAAAATAVKTVFVSGQIHKGPTYPFIVDHPFFFAIKDEQSTFFLGHVTRPN